MSRVMSSERTFLGVATLFFAASIATTIVWCTSMRAMGEMPMPGGWTMSMTWMRMPGHSWTGATASFTAMWTVMMVAMMLPSLVPRLLEYRSGVVRTDAMHLGLLTTIVSAGYFLVWIAAGIAVFSGGVSLASIAMRQPMVSRAVPIAGTLVVLIAGLLQFTAWKSRHLASCRETNPDPLPPTPLQALHYGVRLGIRCVYCCGNLMAILVVAGVMDLRVMALVTVAVTAERVAGPRSSRVTTLVAPSGGSVRRRHPVVPSECRGPYRAR